MKDIREQLRVSIWELLKKKDVTFDTIQEINIKEDWDCPVAYGVLRKIASFKNPNYLPTNRSAKLLLGFFKIPFVDEYGGLKMEKHEV